MKRLLILLLLSGCNGLTLSECHQWQEVTDAFYRCRIDESCDLTMADYKKLLRAERLFLDRCRHLEDG